MSLIQKLKKNSSIKATDLLENSDFFNEESVTTDILGLNIALSGEIDGGYKSGVTMWAGPSKHFKTLFSLTQAKGYMDKYPDSVMIFYDSERGSPKSYFKSMQIPMDRVLYTPISDVEEFKFDIVKQLNFLEKDDKVIIVLDSLGNLASIKEVEDAANEKSVTDMSRAKAIKSLFRIIQPKLKNHKVPMIVINHTYKEIGLYPKDIVGGGTGSYYSADTIFIVGRQQDKDSTGIVGYDFIINVEKSRTVKEKSRIPISVSFKGGISKYSGLLEIALESGHVIKPSNGWYQRVDMETGEVDEKKVREKETTTDSFWAPIITCTKFKEFVKSKYQLETTALMHDGADDADDEFPKAEKIDDIDYDFSTGAMLANRD